MAAIAWREEDHSCQISEQRHRLLDSTWTRRLVCQTLDSALLNRVPVPRFNELFRWCPLFMAITFILNSPVVTAYGDYSLRGPLSVDEARALLSDGFVSAVGHFAAAQLLSQLLGIEIPLNRITIEMQPGDRALVLRLRERLPEGQVLSPTETLVARHELAELTRIR